MTWNINPGKVCMSNPLKPQKGHRSFFWDLTFCDFLGFVELRFCDISGECTAYTQGCQEVGGFAECLFYDLRPLCFVCVKSILRGPHGTGFPGPYGRQPRAPSPHPSHLMPVVPSGLPNTLITAPHPQVIRSFSVRAFAIKPPRWYCHRMSVLCIHPFRPISRVEDIKPPRGHWRAFHPSRI